MSADRRELLSILERFSGTDVTVVGDLIVDHYIWGSVDRISPEAPVVVVQVTDENRRPGGAANVANNLVSLGAKVCMLGMVGDDEGGRGLVEMLNRLGVSTEGIFVDYSRPTTVKTRVIAHAQQVVRVDREVTDRLAVGLQTEIAERLAARFGTTRGIIVSDYAKGAICPPIFDKIDQGFKDGILGVGRLPVLVDPKAPNFPLYTRASIVKPNRKEAEAASGQKISSREDAARAGREMLSKWNTEMVLITMGDKGMVLVSTPEAGGHHVEVDTLAREVYDVSGAGDTVSAVFLLAMAVDASPLAAARLANIAAGIVVGEIGTAAIDLDALRREVDRGEH